METLQKLSKAIELIKSKDLKKKGRNKFSNYDYYTPDQVAELTTWASHQVKLFPKFDLIRNELGITGKLSIYDIESTDELRDTPIVFELASAIPEIKATNISQQLGGAMTYTKRYLLMNAFDIVDNNLDFDSNDNTQKPPVTESKTIVVSQSLMRVIAGCKSIAEITKLWNANKELQRNESFIDLMTTRKKFLMENGITE